jgi:hypothetical protein
VKFKAFFIDLLSCHVLETVPKKIVLDVCAEYCKRNNVFTFSEHTGKNNFFPFTVRTCEFNFHGISATHFLEIYYFLVYSLSLPNYVC